MQFANRYRELVVLGALFMGAALSIATLGRIELVDGLLYDISVPLLPSAPASSLANVVVVALDQQSLESRRFELTPRVFFGPHYADVIDGLFRGGAKAVGVDIILGFAASRFDAIQPSYDDTLLAVLSTHRDRVVLARTAGTRVAEPYVAAVFDPEQDVGRDEPLAIAYSELVPSEDGVQRWIHPQFRAVDGSELPSLAARLVEVAGGRIADAPFLLAPRAPLESLPTYAFADVLTCIETSPQIIKAAFANKVVLIGSNLTEEDRKRAPDRFLKWPSTPPQEFKSDKCALQPLGFSSADGVSIPGVHIHAAAVESMLTGSGVTLVPRWVRVIVAAAAAMLCALLALYLSPLIAVSALIGILATLFGGSVVTLGAGRWMPIAVPGMAAITALLGGQVARFFGEERKRRRVERAFGHYLAPAIVAQLSEADEELQLGGQIRDITVIFADLSGFTATSDTMDPASLMELTNRYFKVIVEAIDESGGYVDKFIGDSVMAIWGAPASVANPPLNAVASAFEILKRVDALRKLGSGKDVATFDVKIGMSTGPAIVGNVGAPRRLSYTALGPTVNLAARLEKVCSAFGCRIVVDVATMNALRDHYLFCELDAVALKGKRDNTPVYEAIAPLAHVTPEQRDYVARYAAALTTYRQGDVEGAAVCWTELHVITNHGDAVSAPRAMAERARMHGRK